jgi:hypothetical protein
MRSRQLEIKFVGKGLEVDVGCVHFGEKLRPRLRVDVASGNSHGLNASSMAGVRRIHGVFGKNNRVIIGKGHTFDSQRQGSCRDACGTRLVLEPVHLAGLGNIPVLAELAGQIAARRTEREHTAAGVKVIQGFFLDGVNAKTRGTAIGGEDHGIALPHPHKTGPALPFLQAAVARTEVTLNASICEIMPVAAGMRYKRFFIHRSSSR